MRRPPLDLSMYLVADAVLCGQFGVAATVSAAVARPRTHRRDPAKPFQAPRRRPVQLGRRPTAPRRQQGLDLTRGARTIWS